MSDVSVINLDRERLLVLSNGKLFTVNKPCEYVGYSIVDGEELILHCSTGSNGINPPERYQRSVKLP